MTTTTTASRTTASTTAQRDWLRILSVLLTLIGLGISLYLAYAEVSNTSTVCPEVGAFNCDLVQKSVYSKIGPVPVALLGLVGYIVTLLALLLENRVPLLASRGKMIVFAMALFGVMFSAYLTYIEAFVLYAWCVWCVGSAITMTALFVVSLARLWRSMSVETLDEEE